MYEELVNQTLEVPASALGGTDETIVRLTVIGYHPDEYGHRAYSINCGWTSAVVAADPLYKCWYNSVRFVHQMKMMEGLPVIRFFGDHQIERYGSVQHVVANGKTNNALHILVDNDPSHMLRIIHTFDIVGHIVAGQLRDLAIDLTRLGLSESDHVIVLVDHGKMSMGLLQDTISVAVPFDYNFIEGVVPTPIKKHSYSLDEMVARKAECDIKSHNIFGYDDFHRWPASTSRVRVIAHDVKEALVYLQVLKCEEKNSVEGSIVSIASDLFQGLWTNMVVQDMLKVTRPMLTASHFTFVLDSQKRHLESLIRRKGYGVYSSRHEILGIIQDELTELRDAIHDRANDELVISELQDIASGALWAIASIRSGAMSW